MVNSAVKVEIKTNCLENHTLEKVCHDFWPEIVREIGELAPSLKGWIHSGLKYEAEDHRLTLFVPSAMALEYCRSSRTALKIISARKICDSGKTVLGDDEQAREEYCFDPELEEQKYLEEIMAAKPSKEREKKPAPVLHGKRNSRELSWNLGTFTEEERRHRSGRGL